MGRRRGSDDGSRQPGDGDLPELPPEFVVPDDPRELAAEAAAVRAELRAEVDTDAAEPRGGLSGPLIGLALMLVAALGSLVIVVLPYTPNRPVRAPLAAPSAAAGAIGGLLPDVRLPDELGRPVPIRDIRPAALLLTPADCDCDQLTAEVVRVTGDARIPVELIGTGEPPARPDRAPTDRVFTLSDPGGVLARAVATGQASSGPTSGGAGPVAVLVRANGIIAAVIPGLSDANDVRAALARLPVT